MTASSITQLPLILLQFLIRSTQSLPVPDDEDYQQPFPKYPFPSDDDDDDGGNISLIFVMFLGMFIGFALIIIVSTIVYLIQKLIKKRIMLSNDIPGSLDDAALEAEEDRRALDELAPNEQELYFQSKDFLKLNPMNNQELSLSQSLIIQEKGVNAWEFKPNIENVDVIKVANKTELEFSSDGQELSIQTNFPIPKQNEVYYFETKIYELLDPENTIISIGLSTTPYPYFRLPGRHRFSISYDSDGCRRYNQPFPLSKETGLHSFPKLEHGDVIGCGLRTGSRTIFFTRNGKKVSESKIGGHIKFPRGLQVHPTIGATNKCQVHVNLGQMGYVFIEANVKKWGFGPIEGTEVPPPLYTKYNKDVLLESSDLDPNDLNLRNGDFPPNFWEVIATPAEFTDIEDESQLFDDVTMQTLEEEGLRSGDFILPPAEPPLYKDSVEDLREVIGNHFETSESQHPHSVIVGCSNENEAQLKITNSGNGSEVVADEDESEHQSIYDDNDNSIDSTDNVEDRSSSIVN